MVLLRRVLLILLALALPLNGWASISLASPCPMQAVSASVQAEDIKGPCCNELGKDQSKASNPCKPGQECQTGALYFSSPLQTASLPRSSSLIILPVTQLAARAPAVVWRPPLTL